MSESVLDFAGLDAAAAAADVTPEVDSGAAATPEVDSGAGAVETPEETGADKGAADDSGKAEGKQQYNSDGTPVEKKVETKEEELPGSKDTPQEIRKALKALKDADPANAAAVKTLHGAYERFNAYSKVFPKVADAQQAKEFIDLIGGNEGYEKLQSTVQLAEESDELLYSGDSKLIENIVEDLKSQGKVDALGKLAPSFLENLKALDEKGYYAAFAPHFLSGLETVNMPGAINGLVKALADPDPAKAVAAAKDIAGQLKEWYSGLEAENKKAKEAVVSPERKKLEEERAAFQKQQEEFKTNQTKEFQESVAKVCEKSNNSLLGKELAPFLKMPFFKGYGKENLMPLGNTLKSNLYTTLKADNAYQAQMKAMWGAKNPDRAKIEEYHRARVESIAAEIVRDTVQKMYPGYAKGGAAAGRVAAAAEKKAVVAKVEQKAAATGKPIYVAAKPKWDAIDWEKDPKQLLYITGKAYLKDSGKLVTWRK